MLETQNFNHYLQNPFVNIWPQFKPSKWTRYEDRWEREVDNTTSVFTILNIERINEGECFQCSLNGSPVNVLRLIYKNAVYVVVEDDRVSHQYYSLLDDEKLPEFHQN